MTQIGPWAVVTANLIGVWLQDCRDPKVLDYRLERLTAAYVMYRLPLPPADAPLVRYQMTPATKDTPAEYSLAFQIAPAKGGKPPKLMSGESTPTPNPPDAPVELVLPDPTKFGKETWFGYWAFAVQCKARGWDALAREALVRELAEKFSDTPEMRVHVGAWQFWVNEITKPGTDRAVIARHLHLALSARRRPAEPDEQDLIRSLELALVPSKAKPGSVEARSTRPIDRVPTATPGRTNRPAVSAARPGDLTRCRP